MLLDLRSLDESASAVVGDSRDSSRRRRAEELEDALALLVSGEIDWDAFLRIAA